jgi:DNA-binding FadR family transcriptional regulator
MPGPQGGRDEARLVDRVASALRHRILAGELPAGTKLPSEAQLTAELGVSRPVVREAVSRLRAAGVVETHKGRGSYVVDPGEPARTGRFTVRSTADLRHLMELRVALESEAAALAARRRSPAHRVELDEALGAFVRAVDDPARVVAADFAFHLAVAEAAGNPLLVELLLDVGPHAILLHRTQLGEHDSAADPEHRRLLVHEHRAVHDAVVRGDADAARAAMGVHLRRSLAALDGARAD